MSTADDPRAPRVHTGVPASARDNFLLDWALETWKKSPDRAADGTATWSLMTLRRALRSAGDGLPGVSTDTIGRALHAAGLSWQEGRSWCDTGTVLRKRKAGAVAVTDPDTAAKKT